MKILKISVQQSIVSQKSIWTQIDLMNADKKNQKKS